MEKEPSRGQLIRDYLISKVKEHPDDLAKIGAAHFGITRQAISKHIQKLVRDGVLRAEGNTRNRTYHLAPEVLLTRTYSLKDKLEEDSIWSKDLAPLFEGAPSNVVAIWVYGVSEMINNAIDHSEGKSIHVMVARTEDVTSVIISDDGVGIFQKLQQELDLADENHAVLELSKGKLTTDPSRHSGEGIFFTSRVFDLFMVASGSATFSHQVGVDFDVVQMIPERLDGTTVFLQLGAKTKRTTSEVFEQYSSGEDFAFNRTLIPVRLVQYGDDLLVSRSQAKRLLARVDCFDEVVLDFDGIQEIGQAFADEVFRVFPKRHPGITLRELNAGPGVARMISRARALEG